MLLSWLEWIGALGGAAGALLLALNNRWSAFGWPVFLILNVAWISHGLMTQTFGMVFMQIVCTGTSLVGIHRWWILPRREAARIIREDDSMLSPAVIFGAGRGNSGDLRGHYGQ